jgi:hypothetical protein
MRPAGMLVSTLPPARQPAWRSVLLVGAVGLALGGLLLFVEILRIGPDSTAPFHVGARWRLDEELAARGVEVQTQPGPGYDGQWFLGLAYDPLLLDDLTRTFDQPRYRAGRPLYAMAGWALAAGLRPAVPMGLLAVGPLAVGLGAMALARILASYRRSRWWGLLFGLVPGVGIGVTFGTAEPLGLALAVLGLSLTLESTSGWAGSRRPHAAELWAGVAFAGAALTKESYLVFAAAGAVYLAGLPGRVGWSRLRPAVTLLVPGLAALAVWWAYVLGVVAPVRGHGTPLAALGPPFLGWVRTLELLARGAYQVDALTNPIGYMLLGGSLAVLLAGIVVGLRSTTLPARVGLALGCYALLLSATLLGHFMSSMRALAPSVLGCGLAVAIAILPASRSTPAPAPNRSPAIAGRPGADGRG